MENWSPSKAPPPPFQTCKCVRALGKGQGLSLNDRDRGLCSVPLRGGVNEATLMSRTLGLIASLVQGSVMLSNWLDISFFFMMYKFDT